jgi:hypothetical protein
VQALSGKVSVTVARGCRSILSAEARVLPQTGKLAFGQSPLS